MKLKTVITDSLRLMQDDLYKSFMLSDDYLTDMDQEEIDEIELLKFCANQVINLISSEYMPLIEKEEVASSGKILFSELSKSVNQIFKIKKRNGVLCKFEIINNTIITESGNLVVVYSYLPKDLETPASDVENFNGKLTSRILAYGTISEYLFIKNDFAEASAWENRFKNSLENIIRKKHEIKLPARRWL